MLTRRCFISGIASGAACLSTAIPTRGPMLHPVRLPGVDFIHRNSPTSQKYLIETMCGGVALFDYNNDGQLDIFFVNGEARTLLGQGRGALAETVFRKALSVNSNLPGVHLALGRILLEEHGDLDGAENQFRAELRLRPEMRKQPGG